MDITEINTKSLLSNVRDKIYLCFLNKFVAKPNEYYGFTEPSVEWMHLHNKQFWIQPIGKEEMK